MPELKEVQVSLSRSIAVMVDRVRSELGRSELERLMSAKGQLFGKLAKDCLAYRRSSLFEKMQVLSSKRLCTAMGHKRCATEKRKEVAYKDLVSCQFTFPERLSEIVISLVRKQMGCALGRYSETPKRNNLY